MSKVRVLAGLRGHGTGPQWYEVSDNLPTDFGFAIAVHAHDPDMICVIPIKSDMEHYPPDEPLPDAIARGSEEFIIVGAIAGG